MRRVPGVVLVVSVLAGRAYAQFSSSDTLAEQLFKQARELAKANRWAEACPKFEASLRYDAALGTVLNLAACYEHIGKLASAWGLYRETIDLAKRVGDVKKRDYAQKQVVALEPQLARLTIAVPIRPPAGFAVTRDGIQIDAGALGVALYVDAGRHEIKASAPGFGPFVQTVMLVDGKSETLAIPDLAPVPRGAGSDTEGPHVRQRDSRGDPGMATGRKLALASGALAVVGTINGGLFALRSRSKTSAAEPLCTADFHCTADGVELVGEARTAATVAYVSYGVSLAAAAAGVVLWFTSSQHAGRADHEGSTRVAPLLHPGLVGLDLEVRF